MICVINTTDKQYTKEDFNIDNLSIYNSKEYNLKHCTGCFGCWMKHPGVCYQKDDMPILLEAMINSDLVVFITEIKVGMVSSELKRINDKMIPLLLPYMDIVEGEVHHKKRYNKYPSIGLVLIDGNHITDEVFDINHNLYKRFVLNFRSKLDFFIKDTLELGGLKNEINHY